MIVYSDTSMSTSKHNPPPKKVPDLEATPSANKQAIKVVCFLTDELAKKIHERAVDMFGERKGNVSLYMEQAMRIHLHMTLEGVKEI
jgi:hypothetical protein